MKHKISYLNENEDISYWQSYSDMMAALLLLFVLIMSSSLLISMNLYEERLKEKELANAELEQQQLLLTEQQTQLEEQQRQLEEQQRLLDGQQLQLDQLVGIKEEIIRSLSDELEKTALSVAVDPATGSIAFDSNILFDLGAYELTQEGEEFLNAFIPIYFKTLLESEYAEYISEIIIEGHTDTAGEYTYNLELSQKRALSVSQYCLENSDLFSDNDSIDIKQIRSILTANGRSWSNPVLDADGNINMDASRRVEFKFRLKDDEMIEKMKGILEDD